MSTARQRRIEVHRFPSSRRLVAAAVRGQTAHVGAELRELIEDTTGCAPCHDRRRPMKSAPAAEGR